MLHSRVLRFVRCDLVALSLCDDAQTGEVPSKPEASVDQCGLVTIAPSDEQLRYLIRRLCHSVQPTTQDYRQLS